MTFKTKYPWPEIKTKYVEGIRQDDGSLIYPTLDELADEYGCCISTTLRRSALGKWQTERLMFLNKLEQARQENRVAFLASQSAEFDRNVLELTLAGIIEITKHFEA
ncbi:MAG: hypothetical protein M1365_06385, partial [Actinobacteria bacterium]|nr:hypothetical protein [Actinomycetota bacterium]